MAIKVVRWGTGNVGTNALHGLIAHPGLELAGVAVSSPAKDGVDAGSLCGLPDTGSAPAATTTR